MNIGNKISLEEYLKNFGIEEESDSSVVEQILYLAINVETNEERKKSILQEAVKAGLPLKIVPAITENSWEIRGNNTAYCAPKRLKEYSNDLTVREQACVESHLKCLQEFLKTNYQYCLIFEDDAKINPNIKEYLHHIIKKVEGWDYIKLWNNCTTWKLGEIFAFDKQLEIVYPKNLSKESLAIIYTRNCAKDIIKYTNEYWLAYDTFLGYISCKYKIKGIGVKPDLCTPISMESCIGDRGGKKFRTIKQTIVHFIVRISNSYNKRKLFKILKGNIQINNYLKPKELKAETKLKIQSAYEKAWECRNFEINKFWSRATFFWAFITLTFSAYGYIFTRSEEVLDKNIYMQFALLCILAGIALSVIWFESIKASKIWQENWESHIELLEDYISGPIYKSVITDKKIFPSVSKLAQLVSVGVIVSWIIILIIQLTYWKIELPLDWIQIITGIIFVVFIIVILFKRIQNIFLKKEPKKIYYRIPSTFSKNNRKK